MDEAIFGLVGVAVGALVTRGGDLLLLLRSEKRTRRTTAMLLHSDLLMVRLLMGEMLRQGRWSSEGFSTHLATWDAERRNLVGPDARNLIAVTLCYVGVKTLTTASAMRCPARRSRRPTARR